MKWAGRDVLIAAAIFILIALGGMVLLVGNDRPYAIWTDTILMVAAWTGTGLLVRRARRVDSQHRKAWIFLAAGLGSEALAETTWWIYEVARNVEVPFPGAADAFYLLGYPLIGIGLFMLAPRQTSWMPRVQAMLDGLFITGAIFMASWLLVLRPSVADVEGIPPFEIIVNVAYPVLDVLLAAMALTFITRTPRGGIRTMALLAGGMLIWVVGDSGYLLLELQDAYGSGYPTDITWVIGYLMIGVAATLPTPIQGMRLHWRQAGWQQVVPGVLLLGFLAIAMYELVVRPQVDGIYIATFAIVILALAARQALTVREVQHLQQATYRAAESAKAYVENSQDVVILVGPDLELIYANPALPKLTGKDPEVLRDIGVLGVLHPDDQGALAAWFKQLLDHPNEAVHLDLRFLAADGSYRAISATGTNHLRNRDLAGVLINARDVTEERHRHQEEMRKESREAIVRERQQLINGAAHILHTPLTPAMLQLGTLRDAKLGPLTESQADAVASIERNLRRLQEASEDVIKAFRIQSMEGFDVLRIDAARILTECIGRSGVPVTVEAERKEMWADGDPSLAREACMAMLDHLKSYDGEGPFSARVTWSPEVVAITVPEPRGNLTDKAAQGFLDPFREELEHRGGLGLYICRTALEKQGGGLRWKQGKWVLTLPASKG